MKSKKSKISKTNESSHVLPREDSEEPSIDINCDMGEGVGTDEDIMPFISSANIACGYHAGNEEIMGHTIDLALKYNVAIGAHPSFFDRENFGRREMNLPADEIYDLVFLQLRTIDKIVREKKASLNHVKPHGALYNISARNPRVARAIAQAVKDFDDRLILFVLSNSPTIEEARLADLKTASEVFADRTYQDDGSLTPRSQSDALIQDSSKCVEQVLQMIRQKTVTSVNGKVIPIMADTICIHGDGKHAVEFAAAIHQVLKKEGIKAKACQSP
jgi:UPF0271 protein